MPVSNRKYDLVVSFAGEDRVIVEECADLIRKDGYEIFYDNWMQADLWGKDLYQYLDDIYRKESNYCLVFLSKKYIEKMWCRHELRSAQARAFSDRMEYILPIKLDDAEIPGIVPTIGYIDLRVVGPVGLAEAVRRKVGPPNSLEKIYAQLNDANEDMRCVGLSKAAFVVVERIVDKVRQMLVDDPSPIVRARAAWALDNYRDATALSYLIAALSDPEWEVRSNAAWAIVHLGRSAVAEMEIRLGECKSPQVREMYELIRGRVR